MTPTFEYLTKEEEEEEEVLCSARVLALDNWTLLAMHACMPLYKTVEGTVNLSI